MKLYPNKKHYSTFFFSIISRIRFFKMITVWENIYTKVLDSLSVIRQHGLYQKDARLLFDGVKLLSQFTGQICLLFLELDERISVLVFLLNFLYMNKLNKTNKKSNSKNKKHTLSCNFCIFSRIVLLSASSSLARFSNFSELKLKITIKIN